MTAKPTYSQPQAVQYAQHVSIVIGAILASVTLMGLVQHYLNGPASAVEAKLVVRIESERRERVSADSLLNLKLDAVARFQLVTARGIFEPRNSPEWRNAYETYRASLHLVP